MATENNTTTLIRNIDTTSARLSQAQGVLTLLVHAGGDTLQDGFSGLPHKTVMESLWAIEELLTQAQAAVSVMNAARSQ